MHLLFSPLFSGSSGNAIYVGNEDGAILVDAGMSARAIIEEMNTAGLDPETVKAIVVTHEHSDHVQGLGPLARKLKVPIYATQGTWDGIGRKAGKLDPLNVRVIERGVDFYAAGMNVMPFATPHDARESCGYLFSIGGIKAAVATDLGNLKAGWLDFLLGCDIVLLESNYDPDMLIAGPYPVELKTRIKGLHGHLSNVDAGSAAVKLVESGTGTIILGHLSKENNFPELALETCRSILYEHGYDGVNLSVARRDGTSGVFEIKEEG